MKTTSRVRFFGQHLSSTLKVSDGLSGILGIGKTTSARLCRKVGILSSTPLGSLEESHRIAIASFRKDFPSGGILRAQLRNAAVQGLRSGEDRFVRQKRGLPSRKQRTRTNGKTAKRENPKRFRR